MPVLFVELGNEFYNEHADNVAAFPTGADYGRTASTWLAAVRAAHPAAAISVVGVPSYRDGSNARLNGWNTGLFSTLTGGNPTSGNGELLVFKPKLTVGIPAEQQAVSPFRWPGVHGDVLID